MTTAIGSIIAIIENVIAGGSTKEDLQTALDAAKLSIEADEDAKIKAEDEKVGALRTDLDALAATVAGLAPSASVDLTPITERLTALEARNAADDAAASGLPGALSDPAAPVAIALSDIPSDLVVGTPYSAAIAATGSTALPYAFSIGGGALPDGLSLGAGGQITGTPTVAGSFQFSVQAHDANNTPGVQSYTLSVVAAEPAAPPAIVDQAA